MIKFIFLICLFPIILSAPSQDLDDQDDDNLEEFEEYFHETETMDPEEYAKREETLKENEEIVQEENEEYLNGTKNWFDAINEFSDLPQDEFEKKKTGDKKPPGVDRFFLGDIEPTGSDRVDEASERFFENFRREMKINRANIPDSYDSVALGHVSSVKSQKDCGSCVAFSNMAMIETCFKRATNVFSDFSEQQMVDCGFGQNGADGCDGAYTYAYAKWAEGKDLLAEATYPYKNDQPALTCPKSLPAYKRGAVVTEAWYTYRGNEDTLKDLVATNGAVVTSVAGYGPMQQYKGGVFSGCTTSKTDHAVTVVGYGHADGEDYWLIKNSWGTNWGENGYIRLKRGVGMCGIGKALVTVKCKAVPGPTSPPLTTEKPCDDVYSNCAEMAAEHCYKPDITKNCPKSCGLCKGMTPVASNTCYDEFNNCAELAKTACYQDHINAGCQKSCGLCTGMTPVSSYSCYNTYPNCADLCNYQNLGTTHCKKACGKC